MIFIYSVKMVQFVQFYSYRSVYPVFTTSLTEETILSSLCVLAVFVKGHLAINTWIYFWAVNYFPLVYISVLYKYHTVLRAIAMLNSLKSGHVMPPTIMFHVFIYF